MRTTFRVIWLDGSYSYEPFQNELIDQRGSLDEMREILRAREARRAALLKHEPRVLVAWQEDFVPDDLVFSSLYHEDVPRKVKSYEALITDARRHVRSIELVECRKLGV